MLAPAAAAKGIELAYELDDDLPRAVSGDVGRLRQVLLNLLSNAVKFTEHGEVVLRVGGRRLAGRAVASDSRCGRSWSRCATPGIGIPADRMDRLFQSFSQADLSVSRRYGGTGLGLAISRRLAELMDGDDVGGEPWASTGEGSDLPAHDPRRRGVRPGPAADPRRAPARAGGARGR